MTLRTTVLALVLVSLITALTEAGPRRMRRWQAKPAPAYVHLGHATSAAPSAAYWRGAYPRYYDQIHARRMQEIGIPSGDIGLRGNSITSNPW